MNKIVAEDCEYILNVFKNEEINIQGKVFLVAGATSFLGISIIDVLVFYNRKIAKEQEELCEIYASYHNKKKAKEKLKEFSEEPYFHMFEWDAASDSDSLSSVPRVDYIFYLCSIAATNLSIEKPVETVMANTLGLCNILKFATQRNVLGVLFFSSGAIYGTPEGMETVVSERDMWSMDHMDLKNVYAESKRVGETICKSFYIEYGVPVKIVRISHTYGPRIDINDGRVFSDFVKCIVNNNNIVIKGDGSDVRPFCYITDAIIGFFLIIMKGVSGQAYNMANVYETYSVGELAEVLIKTFSDRVIDVDYINTKGNIHPAKGYVCIEKLKGIGWNPQIPVEEGFKRVVESIEI